MASCFPSSRTLCAKTSALAERQQVQEAPAGNGEQARQQPVDWQKSTRMTADEARDDGNRREDAAPSLQLKAGTLGNLDVLARRAVARMFVLRRGANQSPGQQEVEARLQVREVRD